MTTNLPEHSKARLTLETDRGAECRLLVLGTGMTPLRASTPPNINIHAGSALNNPHYQSARQDRPLPDGDRIWSGASPCD